MPTLWEYTWMWAWTEDIEESTGERGLFGGEKKQKVKVLFGRYNGQTMKVQEALDRYGANGWELVAAVPATAPYAKGSYDAVGVEWVAHWLYFKRRNPQTQTAKKSSASTAPPNEVQPSEEVDTTPEWAPKPGQTMIVAEDSMLFDGRQQPGKPLGSIPKGTKVKVLSVHQEWARIRSIYGYEEGFVALDDLIPDE